VKDRRLVERFWDDISVVRMIPVALAVFFTFGSFAFLIDVMNLGRARVAGLVGVYLLSGGVAVAFLYLAVRRRWWGFPIVVAVQVGVSTWLSREGASGPLSGDALRTRLVVDATGAILGIVAGYALFMTFINSEGVRRVRAQAEIALARDIHVSLVPTAVLEAPWCELYGRSLPASEVGGDLVDAVLAHGRALGVVADVSGHGVPAGAVMGLVKASVRTRLRVDGDLGALVADVNEVLADLTQANTFVTAAVLSIEPDGRLVYVLAGHPPILHLDAASGAVSRLSCGALALGIRRGEPYAPAFATLAEGDVLAVLTDGFTETMDGEGRELGLEPLERTLAAHAGEPLPQLFERLLEVAQAFGPQQDDRTLLLARVRQG
jgi:sigma-B regulation protein RsbU (phosphoserine phosphatase)